jgi:phosphoheptose isomerase
MHDYIKNYIAVQKETLDQLPRGKVADVVQLFKQALDNGRQIFVFGNGGKRRECVTFCHGSW